MELVEIRGEAFVVDVEVGKAAVEFEIRFVEYAKAFVMLGDEFLNLRAMCAFVHVGNNCPQKFFTVFLNLLLFLWRKCLVLLDRNFNVPCAPELLCFFGILFPFFFSFQ